MQPGNLVWVAEGRAGSIQLNQLFHRNTLGMPVPKPAQRCDLFSMSWVFHRGAFQGNIQITLNIRSS